MIIVVGIILILLILKKTKKLITRLISLALIVFLAYSSLTYEGAVRFRVAIETFDVINAYTHKVEEIETTQGELRYFKMDETHNYECKSITIFKICNLNGS